MRTCVVCAADIGSAHLNAKVCGVDCRAIRNRDVGRSYDKQRDRTDYYAKNRKRINQRSYAWRLAHIADVNARARNKWHGDPEHRAHKLTKQKERSAMPAFRQRTREWARRDYRNNPEKYLANSRASWWRNRSKRIEASREWKRRNVSIYRASLRKYGLECAAAVTALKELGFMEALECGAPMARKILRELELT